MSEVCECGIPITTKKGIRYKDAKDEKQLRAHFDHQSKHQGKRHSDKIKALKAQLAAAEEKNALYERLLAKAEWIQFDNGKSISQPCDQPEGSQCWHDQDENLYDTALLAFAALRGE